MSFFSRRSDREKGEAQNAPNSGSRSNAHQLGGSRHSNLNECPGFSDSSPSTPYQSRIRDLDPQLDDAIARIYHFKELAEDSARTMARDYDLKIDRMQQDHTQALEAQDNAHAIRLSEQADRHEREKRDLKSQIERLNEVILRRDDEMYKGSLFSTSNLPKNTDEKIRSDFMDLQHMVEGLSKAEWKDHQEDWTDSVLERMNAQQHGARTLKKSILQDLIWSILFQRVFCSPFRIFGEAGRQFEMEWTSSNGQDPTSSNSLYAWPLPDVETERFRYLNLAECRDVLISTKPSQIDRRNEIKTGYGHSIDGLIDVLGQELSKIVAVDSGYVRSMRKTVDKAIKLWLDWGQHRCRLILVMPQSTLERQDKYQMQRVPWSLTLQPEVQRCGNVKGSELENGFVTVRGCDASILCG